MAVILTPDLKIDVGKQAVSLADHLGSVQRIDAFVSAGIRLSTCFILLFIISQNESRHVSSTTASLSSHERDSPDHHMFREDRVQ